MRTLALICTLALVSALVPSSARALDADDLDELLGYTMIASSQVTGEFEGADYEQPIRLDNGMIFQFAEYQYSYAYRPTVAVFVRKVTPEEFRRAGIKDIPSVPVELYKLVIDDDIYDATRLL